MITQERLKELLHYDPTTGLFTWNVERGGIRAGTVAGTINRYVYIQVDGKKQLAQRLAWLYVHGTWPNDQIDHKNEDKTDNRIDNLREATRLQNQQNQSKPKADNTSGYRGVCYDKSRKQWKAQISVGGRNIFVSRHTTAEEAGEAYLTAKRERQTFWTEKECTTTSQTL